MHEVGLMQAALAIALDQAAAQGASKIHALEMHVGQQSGVVPAALAFAFEVVSAGTAAAGAELRLKSIPTRCYCARCRQEFQPTDWVYECPVCHGLSTDIRQGQDLELASLEVS
ncbi:hydrogenase maturation nickel metallochaperone HypA [Leptolyngbya sp. CCNP1308]|uniref:hydrogenase maturation nickel metallochaperone HypA n=1 Tax=Leptolyngbya sp. CCNP1308 TaxID=3110255 RepID=UPI002B2144A7|nr:hydrogenase maturation nickel metallochaperone HypA [Leptolyngbya sp. CCNP1308]MEA5449129.1 hydrogenase maturation nickel metallochaperone HypA [Leptolyngbya sp. CCNP1308]